VTISDDVLIILCSCCSLKAQPTSSTAVEPTEPLISLTLQAALAGKLLPSDDDNSLYGSASEGEENVSAKCTALLCFGFVYVYAQKLVLVQMDEDSNAEVWPICAHRCGAR